jgi:hypothetical protein
MADKPEGNPLDAWMTHIDQNQGSQAPRTRQVMQKAAEKKPPQQRPKT